MPDIIGNQTGTHSVKQEKRDEVRLKATSLFVIMLGAFLGLTWLSAFVLFIIR